MCKQDAADGWCDSGSCIASEGLGLAVLLAEMGRNVLGSLSQDLGRKSGHSRVE